MNSDDEDASEDDDDDMQGSRANAIGVLAECMSGLGLQLGQYVNLLLPYLLTLTKDASTNVRNNSLYTIGEMTLHGKEHVYQYPLFYLTMSYGNERFPNDSKSASLRAQSDDRCHLS